MTLTVPGLVQIIQAHGGAVDPTLSSRCTHLLCESQVSGMFAQVSPQPPRPATIVLGEDLATSKDDSSPLCEVTFMPWR